MLVFGVSSVSPKSQLLFLSVLTTLWPKAEGLSIELSSELLSLTGGTEPLGIFI